MMTHDEMIAIIQAHKEGKEIQSRLLEYVASSPAGPWNDINTPTWNFALWEYRIKPKPVEQWAVVHHATDGYVEGVSLYSSKAAAERYKLWAENRGKWLRDRVILLREVMDE